MFDKMFDNIGDKIKMLAKVICLAGIIISLIAGIALMSNGSGGFGFLTIVVGALLSWVGTFVLYGFGKLVENSDIMVQGKKTEEPKVSE